MMPATRLLFAQIWEDSALPRMEEGLVEDAEMAKLISLIREKAIVMFTADWKSPYRLFDWNRKKWIYNFWLLTRI